MIPRDLNMEARLLADPKLPFVDQKAADYLNQGNHMTLFTLKIEIVDEPPQAINYATIEACFQDVGLKSLFDAGKVRSCVIESNGQRLASLPRMTWKYLTDAIISNAATLLRNSLAHIE